MAGSTCPRMSRRAFFDLQSVPSDRYPGSRFPPWGGTGEPRWVAPPGTRMGKGRNQWEPRREPIPWEPHREPPRSLLLPGGRVGAPVNLEPLRDLAVHWGDEAKVLRRRGAPGLADALLSCSDELEAALDAWLHEELDIRTAAAESGYTEDHLRDLVRSGRLPDPRPPGSEGRIHIRRDDLPRRPGPPPPDADVSIVQDLAAELQR